VRKRELLEMAFLVQLDFNAMKGALDQLENRWSSATLEKTPTPAVRPLQRSVATCGRVLGLRSAPAREQPVSSIRCEVQTQIPLPVVTWTRSGASAGSYPIATSIATFTNVLVAPVSRANLRIALPLGPSSLPQRR